MCGETNRVVFEAAKKSLYFLYKRFGASGDFKILGVTFGPALLMHAAACEVATEALTGSTGCNAGSCEFSDSSKSKHWSYIVWPRSPAGETWPCLVLSTTFRLVLRHTNYRHSLQAWELCGNPPWREAAAAGCRYTNVNLKRLSHPCLLTS